MNILVAGSRTVNDVQLIEEWLDRNFDKKKDTLVSGGAKGVDTYAENWARDNDANYDIFLADWDMYGKQAGFFRNEKMVKFADRVVVFWDGESPGTRITIDLALRYKKNIEVVFAC